MSNNLQINIVKIELSSEDQKLFALFRKYQDDFMAMLEGGIFKFKNGDGVIRRDGNGKIRKIIVPTYEK